MHSGSQPPVLEISAFMLRPCTTLTWEAGRSVIASMLPPSRAFTWAVESLKSMIVTVSKYGSPLRQ